MSLRARPSKQLSGTVAVPGDKSISHRALMLGASAVGETRITGLLESEDVLATADALRALGAEIERAEGGIWRVYGTGVGGLREADRPLDLGNSGTGARLLMGLVATQPILTFFTGDDSLSSRPMDRVIAPLEAMGAQIRARAGGRLPLAIEGTESPIPIDYAPPVASAQIKSAILLAGLNTPGTTIVRETSPTRDHTERMLRHFGAEIASEATDEGGRRIALSGQPELEGADIVVPADPSSAAFPIVAALIAPGSVLTVPGIGVNPLRTGLYQTLAEMGADIAFSNEREVGGEPVADATVRASLLRGVEVPARRAPAMIDEYPILAVAASFAHGTTVFRGIGELRVKESDRLTAIADGLRACGVTVEVGPDELTIHGIGGPPPGDATVTSRFDHRIAMAFLVLGLGAEGPVAVDDTRAIATSFPDFANLMRGVGADLAEGNSEP